MKHWTPHLKAFITCNSLTFLFIIYQVYMWDQIDDCANWTLDLLMTYLNIQSVLKAALSPSASTAFLLRTIIHISAFITVWSVVLKSLYFFPCLKLLNRSEGTLRFWLCFNCETVQPQLKWLFNFFILFCKTEEILNKCFSILSCLKLMMQIWAVLPSSVQRHFSGCQCSNNSDTN